MSHEISQVNGVAEMVSGRNMTPWHKLGTVVSGLMTAQDALEKAHLTWGINRQPVMVNGIELPFPKDGESNPDAYQAICRSDNGACLGISKGRYEPITNVECFDFFDRLIGQGKAVYDTAGALRGGKQVWLLAKVDGEIQINGDAHRQYGLMLTSHDGSYALQVSWVLERVVCANTLSLALRGQSNTYKIRHSKSWKDKEAEAATVLGLGEHYFKSIQEALTSMTSKLLSPEDMAAFAEILLPSKTPEVSTRTANIRAEISKLFAKGEGNKGASRWDAFNAVTDYVDHDATLRGDNSTRLESAILGSGAALKQRAFGLLTDESVMSRLINRPHTPSNLTPASVGSDFARLLDN